MKNLWNDPAGYPCFIENDNDPYAQYTQTIFSKGNNLITLPKYKGFTTSKAQSQILEYDVSHEDFENSGFKIAKYFTAKGNRCSKTGYYQECKEDHAINFKPHYCADKIHCPICARARAKSSGRRLYHTLQVGSKHYVAQLVLTIPEWHPSSYNTREARKTVYEWLYSVANRFMNGWFKGYPYVAVIHSWHTNNPLQEPHWHIHVLINLMKLSKDKVVFGSGYRSPKEIEGMRRTWGKMIGIDFKDSNVHWEYCESTNEPKLRHWCNYVTRTAILDVNEFLMKYRRDVTEFTDYEKRWYDFHVEPISSHFRRIRWYGGLSDSTKRSYLLKIGSHIDLVNEAIKDDIKESRRLYCWSCGAELIPANWEWHQGLISRECFAKSNDHWYRYRDVVS
jgi:hypothetical protein